ncbi:uncharacterized protein (DUF2236 family) [Mycobacteroides chelonae]|nr:uncharacterized protein (DUF2236 family) [Mycobacteroides chelonae]
MANIIMQLSLPPVGHGVSESRVRSGSPRRYPLKRARTTGQYLALSVMGSDEDREVMRKAVAEVHSAVHSGADSPVKFSGNSRELQLWVAMCLFKYYLDQYALVRGPLDVDTLDTLTRAAAPLATGVNVRLSEWPQSYAEYEQRWAATVPRLAIDPVVRQEFESLANLTFLGEAWGAVGYALARVGGSAYQFMTRATLPPEFRELMGWDWTRADERRLQRILKALSLIDALINPFVLQAAYRLYIADFRLRRRLGRPVLGRHEVIDVPIRDGGGLRRLARRRSRASATS